MSASATEPRREPAARASRAGLFARALVACALLAASGLVRARQADRFDRALVRGMESPIDLAEVPETLGSWRGEATDLDPQIARATGAAQIVTRRYVDQTTGVRIELILLFGKAVNMYVHSPEVCYPAAGFALQGGMEDRPIEAGGAAPANFRRMVYAKGEGARAERQEVLYAWWYDGRWSPTVGTQKHFERISGMYKVQVARLVTAGEEVDQRGPSPAESFLRALLPDLQRRLDGRTAGAPAA